jgi:hypothetical protein
MADQKQCIPDPDHHPTHPLIPPGWEESAGFRETFLYRFDQPQDQGALRHLAHRLHEMILETARDVLPSQTSSESGTREELRAVAADLRHVQGFLGAVARSYDESDLPLADAELATLAARQAQVVATVALALEQALEQALG